MKKQFFTLLFFGIYVISNVFAQNSPQNKSYSDTWVATDGAGRALPDYTDAGTFKANKYVGVFYWFWHGFVRTNPIRDVTKTLHSSGGNPTWYFQDWYWGEPEDGYYYATDPYVLRKNITMLANAGVDFVYIDFTNGIIDWSVIDPYCSMSMELRKQGIPAPYIVFFLNYDASGQTSLTKLYNDFYMANKYPDLWFKWNGKPLVLAGTNCAANNDILNFFTFRHTWAFQTSQTDEWRFIDDYPQRPSYHNKVVEQICVNKAMGAPLYGKTSVDNKGSSYTTTKGVPQYDKYWECPRTPYGDYFEQEWSRVHAIDPPIVMVSGWNELTAGAWNMDTTSAKSYMFMGKPLDKDPNHWYFVDEFNVEFNRDIEPMKGGYTDNYYYQMLGHIRKYKGMQLPEDPSGSKTIAIDGNFSEWASVTPVFKDPVGDCKHRKFRNVNYSATLINNTGRNDIVESRVTFDSANVYFYVKCDTTITSHNDNNWMLLYIDADKNHSTGWEGYDYVLNMGVTSDTQTTVKKWNGSSWQDIGIADYNVNKKEMEIRVNTNLIAQKADSPSFYFHWNDNPQVLNDITEFFVSGESAPDRRFNYFYSSVKLSTQIFFNGPHNIPGTIEAEDFDKGGEGIAYHDADTANLGGQYRLNEGIDIGTCALGGYDVDSTNSGEWMEYTVNVATVGNYKMEVSYASLHGNDQFHVEFDGIDKTGIITVDSTGGLQTWKKSNINIALTAGKHIMRFYINKSAGEFNINRYVFINAGGVVSGLGDGLNGNYFQDNYSFNQTDWTKSQTDSSVWIPPTTNISWFTTPVASRVDSVINIPKGKLDTFLLGLFGLDKNKPLSVRWTGFIEFPDSGTYNLYLSGADGMRLKINNNNIIGSFSQGDSAWLERPYLEAGTSFLPLKGQIIVSSKNVNKRIPIELEFYSVGTTQWSDISNKGIQFEWENISDSSLRAVVPQNRLYSVDIISDIKQNVSETYKEINVFPNPAHNSININLGKLQAKSFLITDITGKVILQDNTTFSGIRTVDIKDLSKGLYFVKIKLSQGEVVKKVVVE